ncbi:MAG TPA: DUF72 domain-containing protein [Puia sp.]|nr:DUF72 domain-containing protein [Puia sp.]
MEFGKAQYIDNIDFSLPPDDPVTDRLWLQSTPEAGKPLRVHVGGTEWGRSTWVGRVYPRGTKQANFLPFYARQFNTVELNTLFYGLQAPAVIQRWASMVGEEFRFCPKFLETISHKQQLVNAAGDTGSFIDAVRHLGPKLGPSFLQLSEGFGPDRVAVLANFMRALPRDFRVCVELRHPGWFGPAVSPEIWNLFRELGVGTVITDVAGRRDVLHMRLTAPVAFVRFVTNGLHSTDHQRADAWAKRLAAWAANGLEEVYFFVHSPEEQTSPEMMSYVIGRFNETLGAGLHQPQLANGGQPENLSLF